MGILNTSREIVVCLKSSGHPCQEEVVILVCKEPNFQCLYSQCQSNILVKIPCQLQEYRPIVKITSTQCQGCIIVLDGATGPQLPKRRKYPLQVDYQLGSYFKPSQLSLEKFRRKLSYKLKTSIIYSIINFKALFLNPGIYLFIYYQKLDLELTLAIGIFALFESIKEKSILATAIICIMGAYHLQFVIYSQPNRVLLLGNQVLSKKKKCKNH